ncbi:MAG: multiheme c-type cytochrome [Pseudoruegeria sp.]
MTSVRILLSCIAFSASCALFQEAVAEPSYVGSETCADCHQAETKAWAGSHHAKAWLSPTEEHVLGDFGDTTFSIQGLTSRFYREDGRYMVDVTEPDGSFASYPVHSTAGIAPLQQYLIETEPGRLQSFDVVWDTEKKEWYHLYPDTDLSPEDGLHWTGPYKNWNARCAECHATGFEKNYDATTHNYASTQSEIGVTCEACHGPGEYHLQWTKTSQEAPEWGDGIGKTGLTIDFDPENAQIEVQQCASCHSRRESLEDGNPLPGTPFHNAYRLSLLREGLYHDDGSIQDEVYVYGSFLQSKMATKGVRCSNCHEVHEAKLVAEGNAVCTQCHSEAGNSEFESLQLKDYDTAAHHFHPEGSEGAQCKNCHMIERTYMGVDGRRDHNFRVPRPDLSLTTDAPNTCTDCHAGRSSEWAAEELAKRFPDSRYREAHYATTLSNARANPARQVNALLELALSPDQTSIVRATAMDLLRDAQAPVAADLVEELISDPDPLIRASAVYLQRVAAETDRVPRIAAALTDNAFAVRFAAAQEMLPSTSRIARLPKAVEAAFGRASAEWRTSLLNKADFPESHLILGGTALAMRNFPASLSAFEEAVRLDPQLVQAWSIMVRIREATGDLPGARETLTRGLAVNPSDPLLMQTASQLR